MKNSSFNPVNFIISLILGWFLVSFLQSLVLLIISANSSGIIQEFKNIAFFQNLRGVIINIIIIVVFGGIGTSLWLKARKK